MDSLPLDARALLRTVKFVLRQIDSLSGSPPLLCCAELGDGEYVLIHASGSKSSHAMLSPLLSPAIRRFFECTRGGRLSPSHGRSTFPNAAGAAVPGPVRLRAEGLSGAPAPGSSSRVIGSSGSPPRGATPTVASNSLARPPSENSPPPIDGLPGRPPPGSPSWLPLS